MRILSKTCVCCNVISISWHRILIADIFQNGLLSLDAWPWSAIHRRLQEDGLSSTSQGPCSLWCSCITFLNHNVPFWWLHYGMCQCIGVVVSLYCTVEVQNKVYYIYYFSESIYVSFWFLHYDICQYIAFLNHFLRIFLMATLWYM